MYMYLKTITQHQSNLLLPPWTCLPINFIFLHQSCYQPTIAPLPSTLILTPLPDHVERKVPKFENHKLRERKVKTLTRNWRDHRRIGTHKHTETVSRYFDRHCRLFQSEERNVFEHTTKMASLESLWKVPPGGCERDGWREINKIK